MEGKLMVKPGLVFSGGNMITRALAKRLSKILERQDVLLKGEVILDLTALVIMRDIAFLVENATLVLAGETLDFGVILACYHFLSQNDGLCVQNKRHEVLRDILNQKADGLTKVGKKVSQEISELYAFYKRPILINCGGTINMSGAKGRKPAGALVALTSDAVFEALLSPARFSPLPQEPDSSNIGPEEWTLIVNQILDIAAKKEQAKEKLKNCGIDLGKAGGIIVTHGTDTLEETASIIAYELMKHKVELPVVFTGSHSPPDQENSDALANF